MDDNRSGALLFLRPETQHAPGSEREIEESKMRLGFPSGVRLRVASLLVPLASLVVFAHSAAAWGRNAHKLVVNQAIDTLPQDIRGFFESYRGILIQHVIDPLDNVAKTPAEKRNNHLYLDKYGRFPFDALPRSYRAAVAKFGKSKV